MLKKGDIILAGMILLLMLVGFAGIKIFRGQGDGAKKIAVILRENRVVASIDLDSVREPQRIELPGDFREIVLVEKGRIRFEEADCPDRLCVRQGWLVNRGDMAVCLPNRAMIKIEGEMEGVDGIAY